MTALARRGHDNTNLQDNAECHSEPHASGTHCNALCLGLEMQVHAICTSGNMCRH